MMPVRTCAALLLLAIAIGCSKGRRPLLERTRHKTHPAVREASVIEPDALLLTLRNDGGLFMDGKPATLEDVAALKPPLDQAHHDPVVIEASPENTAGGLTPLLRALIVKAGRRNVAFLVSTPSGPGVLHLPVIQDHGLSLTYTVGRVDYRESERGPDERPHLWMSIRVDGPGKIRVVEILKRRFNEIWFPDQEAPGTPDPRLWTGPHPPLGPWSPEHMKRFLEEPAVKQLTVFCDLQVHPTDKVDDFLKCLDFLNELAEGRTIVSFVAP